MHLYLTLTMAHNFSLCGTENPNIVSLDHTCLNNYSKKMVANETHVLLKYSKRNTNWFTQYIEVSRSRLLLLKYW
jgi:hypothetical protein